jgi:transposase
MSKTSNRLSPEVRDGAVRMVGEHGADFASEWAALTSIAGEIGCTTETLRRWCREEASPKPSWLGAHAAQTSHDNARLKMLEREVKELRRAN